jgi:hypothetical protein
MPSGILQKMHEIYKRARGYGPHHSAGGKINLSSLQGTPENLER